MRGIISTLTQPQEPPSLVPSPVTPAQAGTLECQQSVSPPFHSKKLSPNGIISSQIHSQYPANKLPFPPDPMRYCVRSSPKPCDDSHPLPNP